ncbi:MAG: eda [Amycolatopsis sp.]|uniref:bifunctional 4-hydroxy-2-oxoglutarate aldolase/2-dehydro-3-deoxy-phosphogluconate aldolase n=1 Tax=Amycolatopsis sp. TaxID=37632 RepID=UPI002620F29E|nr:bifunctional 4-hydroxy-2-oxoglutarate aldolase/2-dehydro-3-deoxy-phosphogluconate aldolase [Amycolatopsis sp.]MCU1683292.1 eda [Amycolatopsis sp.]
MGNQQFRATVASHGLVAILRADDSKHFAEASEVLYKSGVRVLEATLTTPDAPAAIAAIRQSVGEDAMVGAGSVRTATDVDTAAEAGATFLVTPTVNPAVLSRAAELGLPVLCGAMTPTEIDYAWQLGAAAVKIFPAANLGGLGYLKAVRAPMPDIALVPTGGVKLEDVGPYLAAGALAVAAATPLLGDVLSGGSMTDLATRAARFAEAAGQR